MKVGRLLRDLNSRDATLIDRPVQSRKMNDQNATVANCVLLSSRHGAIQKRPFCQKVEAIYTLYIQS
ncbi:hypothetical protein NDN08_002188 [Rhodosorus marinus]|uniref:Uncharacterized protein n=1 Tax=Rhodosorus marinus TaxID=101924 RepID=A0AAV8UVV0_9RHOD|nr:hypothetical protein NDN08_002188 [Rhodosorus marinus]